MSRLLQALLMKSPLQLLELHFTKMNVVKIGPKLPSTPSDIFLTMLGIESKGQQNTVVDVWDRQYLTIKLTRTSAAKCDLFFASLRLVGQNTEELQSRSGTGGIYVEPRSIDGRSPCSLYRVIWLKLDKASTTAAMQSSHLPVHLARHGTRFGLRAKVDIAEEVHRLHKASVPYLDTPNVIKYVAGPFSVWGYKGEPHKGIQQVGLECTANTAEGKNPRRGRHSMGGSCFNSSTM